MFLRNLIRLKEPLRFYNVVQISALEGRCKYSSATTEPENTSDVPEKKNISKAMRAYLERTREHEEFMQQQNYEYQIGKRHLANMMGENPETFTQKDVDEAIEYLFPSGLYEKKARPIMKPPEEIFPKRKAAEFDESGKPYHFLFYTGRPNFYEVLYNIVEHINELNKFEDAMIRKNLKPDPTLKLELSGYTWLEQDELEKKILETVGEREYNSFVNAIERLSSHPYSYRIKDFIFQYCKPLASQTKTYDAPKPKYDEQGRAYITTYECLRKKARADVTVKSPGSGLITINGKDISYFTEKQNREQILFPLLFTNLHNKVDIEANVEGGGPSGQAGAIRWGIAWSLRSFVDQEMIEQMRLAGLLTRDYRTRERKKPGQAGARRKFTWKKR